MHVFTILWLGPDQCNYDPSPWGRVCRLAAEQLHPGIQGPAREADSLLKLEVGGRGWIEFELGECHTGQHFP